MNENKKYMKRILLKITIACVLVACNNSSEGSTGSDTDTNVSSTTPPPKKDTNSIGIMMGDTTIGINDSLKKDSLKK
jgi:hypothetical protein